MDAKNIALVTSAAEYAPKVMDRFALETISGAARIGFAYALANELSPDGSIEGSRENNFAITTVDEDGEFPELLDIFYPELDLGTRGPYRVVEVLMNRGLIELGQKMDSGTITGASDLVSSVEGD